MSGLEPTKAQLAVALDSAYWAGIYEGETRGVSKDKWPEYRDKLIASLKPDPIAEPQTGDPMVEERLKVGLVFKVEVLPGLRIEEIAERMVRLSNQLNVKLESSFNGIRVICWPGETTDKVIHRFQNEVA